MEVNHLRTLRELRDRGSVTAVAQALHVSASAVSQQLAALQRTTGVPLTRQRGRVLVLTQAGEHLADAASDVFDALSRAEQSVGDYLQAADEQVSVTAFHSAGLAWFPTLIERSLVDDEGPQVQCRDEDVSIEQFVDLVADHDVVVAHRTLASPPWPAQRVRVTPLLVEPIDLALRRDHPLAAQESVQLSDLSGETWLAAHEGFALEPLLVQAHALTTGQPITIRHRVNEFNVAAAIIARTAIVGMLPRYTGLPQSFRDKVVLRPIRDLTIGRHIDILTRPEALARKSVSIVVEWLQSIAVETATRSS